jgi:hypothetical protein
MSWEVWFGLIAGVSVALFLYLEYTDAQRFDRRERSDHQPAGAHRPERVGGRAWYVDLSGRSDLVGRHHLNYRGTTVELDWSIV